MKKKLVSQKIENENHSQDETELLAFNLSYKDEDNPESVLEELHEVEQQMHAQGRQIIDTLTKWQSTFDSITNKKNLLLACIEKKHTQKNQNSEEESDCTLYSVVAYGPTWDSLVFTVMAENDVWAEELVRQWLDSNERANYKIDKIMALVSQDARGIINVGARLLDA